MFANAANANSTASLDNDITLQPDQVNTTEALKQQQQSPASPIVASTRRNLFGIRLNHDQLKQDLNDMWKDQIDRQNQSWGFDFQKLKPLDNQADNENSQRFEWTKVQTRLNPFYNETGKFFME